MLRSPMVDRLAPSLLCWRIGQNHIPYPCHALTGLRIWRGKRDHPRSEHSGDLQADVFK